MNNFNIKKVKALVEKYDELQKKCDEIWKETQKENTFEGEQKYNTFNGLIQELRINKNFLITPEYFNKLFEKFEEGNKEFTKEELNNFIILEDDGSYTSVNNTYGNLYTENFESVELAFRYLQGEDIDKLRDEETKYKILVYENNLVYNYGEPFEYKIVSRLQNAKNELKHIIESQGFYSGRIDNLKRGNEEYSYYLGQDKIEKAVDEVYEENGISDNLEDYGPDDEEEVYLTPISKIYAEILDDLNIKYESINVLTISDGKWLAEIKFNDSFTTTCDIRAWDKKEATVENILSIKNVEEIWNGKIYKINKENEEEEEDYL